jgi:hypothetical protein
MDVPRRIHRFSRRDAPSGALAKELSVKHSLSVFTFAFAVFVAIAPRAEAACITPDPGRVGAAARAVAPPPSLAAPAAAVAATDPSIVGLWNTIFYVGNTSDVWDQAFEQWHADGTELAIDNAVPPSLGNVCVGVWTQVARTIKLRHYTWNWNPDGTKAGTFYLAMTITVDRGGDTYSGTYVSDSYDLNGAVIPALHGEGEVRGTRITAE